MSENQGEHVGRVDRAVQLLKQARATAAKPAVRPWLLAGAGLLFLAMLYSAFRSVDEDWRSMDPRLMFVLVLVGVPAALPLNALEYRTMARMLGHDVDLRGAARVSVAAGLANYLPAPGAIAVRTAALKGRGSSIGAAVSVNAVTGLLWLGTALFAAGAALVVTSPGWRAYSALGLGVAAVGTSALWVRRTWQEPRRGFTQLLMIEAGLVVAAGLRVWLAFAAIGHPVDVGAAVVISCSTVIAAAVGIFPAGLGLKEAIGGGLALAVDVSLALTIVALSVTRVAGLVGMGLCAPLVGIRRRARDTAHDAHGAKPKPASVTAGAESTYDESARGERTMQSISRIEER